MKYKLVQRKNPADASAAAKWYPNAVNAGKITLKEVAKRISGRSSLTRGDIENVLANFIDELPEYLKEGYSVKLGDFGTIRLSISGSGADTPDAFNAGSISAPKVIFTPGTELRNSISDIRYERAE